MPAKRKTQIYAHFLEEKSVQSSNVDNFPEFIRNVQTCEFTKLVGYKIIYLSNLAGHHRVCIHKGSVLYFCSSYRYLKVSKFYREKPRRKDEDSFAMLILFELCYAVVYVYP